jgi:Ca2+-binding RTX toxin-like protein
MTTITGTEGDDVLQGTSGPDLVKGLGGVDVLVGGAGADTLEGAEGDDWLVGGLDADKLDGGAGIDTVDYSGSNGSVTITMSPFIGGIGGHAGGDTFLGVENAIGSDFADSIRGDNVANEIFGGSGVDTLKGSGGADQLFGGLENDILFGDEGDDTLDGGSGADIMRGGDGADTFVVSEAGDRVEELADAGTDAVRSSVSFSLPAPAMQGEVENLILTGSTAIDGVGNALANTLVGNSAANHLNGNSGADRMAGGGGNDSYVVNEAGDTVSEIPADSGGIDDVLSFVSFDLSGPKSLGRVENLRLAAGTANLNAHGNALANELVGNNGVNVITGAAGNDKLTGGGGGDFFVFVTALNSATNVDGIEDYTVAQDTMRLENTFFTGLANGTLAAGAFHVGTAAADASDRILYDDDTGALLFDRDGTGAGVAVRFATLDAHLAMTNAEFFVV